MFQSLLLALAAGAGACIALQAAANGSLRSAVKSPEWAAYFSICGTIICATTAMIILRPVAPATADVKQTVWWQWIGGPLGALIVLAGATLTPKLGAATFVAFVVGGQLVCAALMDQFGLMGLAQRNLTTGRAMGAVFVIFGALLIRYW
ncbi:MAG TPA: DMT family transporter [Fimbriiglobus sp.]|jgi:transporter family-2 protein